MIKSEKNGKYGRMRNDRLEGNNMSRFILHTKAKERVHFKYLMAGIACILTFGAVCFAVHSIGTVGAKSREIVMIYTQEELEQYLLDQESEEYNRNGRYRLEEDLDLSGLDQSIGTNMEPFTGVFDGNGHVISGLVRPLFGVMEKAEVENLFLSGTMITEPFTYYDGEHYVDGYGALAAYTIDSAIKNCGMNGEIWTASPSEAEYQLAKASPPEAEEHNGPGVGDNQSTWPADPSMEANASTAGPANDTVETSASVSESSAGAGMEIIEEETTVADHKEVEETENGENGEVCPESEESGSNSSETADIPPDHESTGADSDLPVENESSEESRDPAGNDSSGGNDIPTDSESPGETDAASENGPTESAEGGADSSQGGEAAVPETIGYQAIEKRYLMMKIPVLPDSSIETDLTATPSDATPSDAEGPAVDETKCLEENQTVPEDTTLPKETEAIEYIGNPNGDIFILVTADRVIAGGLIAQTAGATLVSDSFTLVTIRSDLEDVETYMGGLSGILGEQTRIENSYASGLTGGNGVIGGFAAVNEGMIENSYSTVTIGKDASRRGAFTVTGNGTLSGCMYDRQMACVRTDQTDIGLNALSTIHMTGIESEIPGHWRKTEYAYPQLEYFALHEHEIIADSSRASVIALMLPDEVTLADVVKNGELLLPPEVDGQEVTWEAEGNIRIDERNQVISDGAAIPSIESNKLPIVKSALESAPEMEAPYVAENVNTETASGMETSEQTNNEKPEGSAGQLKASVGNVTRNFTIVKAAGSVENWLDVVENYAVGEPPVLNPGSADTAGTESNPYLLDSPEDLAWFAYQVDKNNRISICGRMMANIDLYGDTYIGAKDESDPDYIEKAVRWIPIGYNDLHYEGVFDGNGHHISNMRVTGDSEIKFNIGLIGALSAPGIVKDVGVKSGSVYLAAQVGAGVVGRVGHKTGGTAQILRCWNAAKVNADRWTGGIAGFIDMEKSNDILIIEDCYNLGSITARNDSAAGILGHVKNGTDVRIKNCFNRGDIYAANQWSGGIYSGGTFAQAANVMVVVENCYNAGNVTSKSGIGGICGITTSQLSIVNCYYDNQYATGTGTGLTTGQLQSWAAAYALNGQKMTQTSESGTASSWTFQPGGNYPVLGSLSSAESWEVIAQGMEDGLITKAKPDGDGTATPYRIETAEQLAWFAYEVNNVTGKSEIQADLTGDIDMQEAESKYVSSGRLAWVPIGKTEPLAFQGVFGEGNQKIYEIQNLYVNADFRAGLFGEISGNAKVMNTGVSGCSVSGTGTGGSPAMAGGIAGRLRGNAVISHSYNRGGSTVTANGEMSAYAGGIAGLMNDKSVIEDCYHLDSTVVSLGSSNDVSTGGITGSLSRGLGEEPKIRNSYNACGASGSITSSNSQRVGGITGSTSGAANLIQCYSEQLLGQDAANGIIRLGTADAELQSDVDGLNTIDTGVRADSNRVWYTSLASETTRGLPTLDAPTELSVTFDPANAGESGITEGLGQMISNAKFRGVHEEYSTTGTKPDFTLSQTADVSRQYHIYGTGNANKNLGLAAGNTGTGGVAELAGLSGSLTLPTKTVDSFDQMVLYLGAAYTWPQDRTIVVDLEVGGIRYEVRVKIKQVMGKTLSFVIKTPVTIELNPGVTAESYTEDLELENRSVCPIQAAVSSVDAKTDTGMVRLEPVASDIEIKNTETISKIKLGITKPGAGTDTGKIGDIGTGDTKGKLYYTPAADSTGASGWMKSEIGYNQKLRFRYFMEHSLLHIGPKQSFGFDIVYQFQIPAGDVPEITVTAG